MRKEAAAAALGATPHSVPGLLYSAFFGWLSWAHEIWINICAAIVTLYTISVVGYCCLPTGVTAPVQRLANMRRNARQQRRNQLKDENTGVEQLAPIIRSPPSLRREGTPASEQRVKFQRAGSEGRVEIGLSRARTPPRTPKTERDALEEARTAYRNTKTSKSKRVQSWASMLHPLDHTFVIEADPNKPKSVFPRTESDVEMMSLNVDRNLPQEGPANQ